VTANAKARIALVVWAIAFPVISCGPAVAGDGVPGTILGGLLGLALGSVLFVPWVIGLVVLGALVFLTNRGRTPPR
jgi:hypothetical protein